MRKRITFIHEPNAAFNPNQLTITDSSLSVRSLHGAREERATFTYNELPQELWQVLKQCHELHIRWAAQYPFEAVPPFASRVAPGLHVFYTPGGKGEENSLLCPLLRKVFDDGLKCVVPEKSFITPPILSTRFASTSSLQFHQLLPSLAELVTYIQQKLCPQSDSACQSHAATLLSADSLDIDYDSISHALTIAGYWSRPSADAEEGWKETIEKDERVEVGVLAMEKATEAEELSVGGFLVVVGEDKKLQPTLFSFPSRHHPLPQSHTYTVSFPAPTGLHPTLLLTLPPASLHPPPTALAGSKCALHTYLTLPSVLFADKYQLSTTDPLFLESHHLLALRGIAGETDLEAPDWVTERWGSNLLLELATPDTYSSTSTSTTDPNKSTVTKTTEEEEEEEGNWTITIPLHLRYLPPSPTGYRNASIPWPVVFWACTTEEGTKMGTNPFDRVGLGWDGLFGPRTMFYQLHPGRGVGGGVGVGNLTEEIRVPVLVVGDGGGEGDGVWSVPRNIEMGTMVVVLLGFLWVLGRLAGVVRAGGVGRGRVGDDKRRKRE
ncbi:protease B nonderepressible form [Emmonsiellopsis sp. PD_33]|nr:protease B nonderepressible form [Emmonsiellopsis sp. PD_33]